MEECLNKGSVAQMLENRIIFKLSIDQLCKYLHVEMVCLGRMALIKWNY